MVPSGVLLLAVTVLAYSGWLTLAVPALSFLYYCGMAGGMLLAWRFHSSRVFLALVALFLAEQAIASLDVRHLPFLVQAMGMLVPLNFVLVCFMQERGFTVESIAPPLIFYFAQAVVVAVLYRANEGGASFARPHHAVAAQALALPGYTLVISGMAATILLVRFLFTRKPVDGALLWSLAAFLLSLHWVGTARMSMLYAATAACILATSIIENSYLLAYHDELTALPSRRSFNDALLRLQEPYSIAVVDIDHFKRFNDTYGHDTGDQVLRLVAANLARVTGGGQAYRCGGEEFTILFPGKAGADVVEHVEQLRRTIQSSVFQVRGSDRRQSPRGAERRNERRRGRGRKGDAIRELAAEKPTRALFVTVSIGLATSSKKHSDAEAVLQVADKALYRAKANGRNRVETDSLRRGRARAAGIA